MKLLLCLKCNGVINLQKHLKRCPCGTVEGKYTDGENAEYSGKAIPFAIDNHSFIARAENDELRNPIYDAFYGTDKIQAWILKKGAVNIDTIKKVSKRISPTSLSCGLPKSKGR